jgi:hypothetical protein
MNTVTVADFTIQITIPLELWKLWQIENTFHEEKLPSFREYFQDLI